MLVLVEIKARFDEEANISWARKLEQAGAHVVYGLVGLKTHCKLSLVVRDEPEGIRRYCHIGTGNYHPDGAAVRGLRSADVRLRRRRGLERPVQPPVRLLAQRVVPAAARRTARLASALIERIDQEAANARAGRPAFVRFKLNSLVDEEIIDALYRASMDGVSVDLWIRGICALKPAVPGLSENIRVRSVLGRFLEHSRVFLFARGGQPEALIGSADMMRNAIAGSRRWSPSVGRNRSGSWAGSWTSAWPTAALMVARPRRHLGAAPPRRRGRPLLDVQDYLITAKRRPGSRATAT